MYYYAYYLTESFHLYLSSCFSVLLSNKTQCRYVCANTHSHIFFVYRVDSLVVIYTIDLLKDVDASSIVEGIKNWNGTFAGYDLDFEAVGVSGM